ncbi:MAG TPA: nitrile hydratase subunit beta, partial [Aestuariivirgaceae bacterium]|nr:nitrile hydratase subunit beta [Aestuariivirgaceae bacterium]
PVFHAEWERRAFALTLAMGATGAWNLDVSRHARESLDPARYLSSTYYQIWLEGLARLLREAELVTPEELATGRPRTPPAPLKRVLAAGDVERVLAAAAPMDREPQAPARFRAGDVVRARNMHPFGHTRLPRYARGRTGEIARVNGAHVFPDSHAHGLGEDPRWLYTVRFTARELWGDDRNATDAVHADLWEPYLEPA